MKKAPIIFTAALIAFIAIAYIVLPKTPIKIVAGGAKFKTASLPVVKNGRIMLSVEEFIEMLNTKEVTEGDITTIKKNGVTAQYTADSDTITIGGKEILLYERDGKMLAPLRECAEAFGFDVEWDKDTRTARVKMPVLLRSKYLSDGIIYKNTYDENYNEICTEASNGSWYKYEYDDNGNMISEIYNNGSKEFYFEYKYDENYNKIYEVMPGDNWYKYEYDAIGNMTYRESSDGYWERYSYDENSNITYRENSDGDSESAMYNSRGQMLMHRKYGYVARYEYDENGNMTYLRDYDGNWYRYTYDENNNMIHIKGSDGTDKDINPNETEDNISDENSLKNYIKTEYDENGNVTYRESSYGWEKYEYDENDNQIYYENSNGNYSKYIIAIK